MIGSWRVDRSSIIKGIFGLAFDHNLSDAYSSIKRKFVGSRSVLESPSTPDLKERPMTLALYFTVARATIAGLLFWAVSLPSLNSHPGTALHPHFRFHPRTLERQLLAHHPLKRHPSLRAGLSTRFKAHIIARGLVQRILCVVFAAEPFAQRDSKLRRRRTHAKNLVRWAPCLAQAFGSSN